MKLTSFAQLPSFTSIPSFTSTPAKTTVAKVKPIIPDNRDFVDERMAIPRTNNKTHAPSRVGLSPFVSKDPNFRRVDDRFALKPHRIKSHPFKVKKAKAKYGDLDKTISQLW